MYLFYEVKFLKVIIILRRPKGPCKNYLDRILGNFDPIFALKFFCLLNLKVYIGKVFGISCLQKKKTGVEIGNF